MCLSCFFSKAISFSSYLPILKAMYKAWITTVIKIPANSYKFEIRPNGDVINYDNAGSLPEKIGTIPIVQFDCPEGLERGHNNKMVVTEDSGNPVIVKENQNIRQYATEVSNTNVYDEVNNMMRLNTSMIASLNLMKVANNMYSKAINLTGQG